MAEQHVVAFISFLIDWIKAFFGLKYHDKFLDKMKNENKMTIKHQP